MRPTIKKWLHMHLLPASLWYSFIQHYAVIRCKTEKPMYISYHVHIYMKTGVLIIMIKWGIYLKVTILKNSTVILPLNVYYSLIHLKSFSLQFYAIVIIIFCLLYSKNIGSEKLWQITVLILPHCVANFHYSVTFPMQMDFNLPNFLQSLFAKLFTTKVFLLYGVSYRNVYLSM